MPGAESTIVPSRSNSTGVKRGLMGIGLSGRGRVRMRCSEQPGVPGLETPHGVVVEHEAADAAVLGEGARLRLDLLGGEHAGDGREQRVAVHELEVAGELLDAVDVAAALDLDGDARALRVAGEDVDWPD